MEEGDRERMSKNVSEKESERKRERTRKSNKNCKLPLSASNAKRTTCNRNFFVAMYLPTNDDLLIIISFFSFCPHFILILLRESNTIINDYCYDDNDNLSR